MKIDINEEKSETTDVYEMWTELRGSEASSTYEDIYPSIFLSHVNERNYQQLKNTLSQFESFDIIQNHLMGDKIHKDQFILITGLFVNYIASAISLRESTRNMQKNKRLFPNELNMEAEERLKKEIIPNTSIKLIEDIRNIITHQSLIIPVLSFVANKGTFQSGYSYNIKELLKNKRLTEKSREHLSKINHGNLYLRPLIDDYHHTTACYQSWIINVALKKHKSENPTYWLVRDKVSCEWGGDLEPSSPLSLS
ncbi:Uncharacterised protein [Enterobacter hormaechei]|uniref:hypothetical protein n=1 Tax=Enterobacter hormaechei TaxID=158836 RepID=UPI00125BAA95|nr:hypothetical protein [Enterobacter hormaechei]VAL98524.1 Uncharacterised protein [Enterobacter hormaechei]